MKNLIGALMAVSFLLFSCQKETLTPNRDDTDQYKFGRVENGVKKPHKVSFYSVADPSQGWVECMPTSFGDVKLAKFNKVGGYGTHVGDIQMEYSTLTFTTCNFGPLEGQLTTAGEGVITADNGDKLNYTATNIVNGTDFTFTGTVMLNGGTGRFMDCTGEMDMKGSANMMNGTAMWTAEGYIIFKK